MIDSEVEALYDEGGLISSYNFGIIMAIVTTMMFAVAGVTTRRLKSLDFTIIQFHYSLISTICSVVWILIIVYSPDNEVFQTSSFSTIVWLKLLGACFANFIGLSF